MSLTRKIIMNCVLGFAMQNPGGLAAQGTNQPSFEQSTAILDTSVFFAIGAQEAEQALRGAFGWPTFQEGFVEGVYFRFDPDGYARFSPSPRLDEDVFETICVEASTACIAKKGVLEIGLTPTGKAQIRINGITPDDRFFISDRKSELPLPPSILEPLDPRLESLLAGGGELLVKREIETVQSVSLAGFSAVTTYLRWVAQKQSPRVFPRGWPVPAQSQSQTASGLTQPNQWSSPNAGPQIAQTTWGIQQAKRENRVGQNATTSAFQGSLFNAAPQSGLRLNGNSQLRLVEPSQVDILQQQIQDLQYNLQQMQTQNNSFNAPQERSEYPVDDLREYSQAFAQQAQGRSLPASPGGLGVGVGVDSYNASPNQDSFRLESPLLSQKQPQIFDRLPQAAAYDQIYLIRRVETLEKTIQEMRREISLQMLELREMLLKASQIIASDQLLACKSLPFNVTRGTGAIAKMGDGTNSSEMLAKLEQKLLARLAQKNQGSLDVQINTSKNLDTVSLDRSLIEDILGELGNTEDPNQPILNDVANMESNVGKDDYITLNDYINRVLRTEGLATQDPSR